MAKQRMTRTTKSPAHAFDETDAQELRQNIWDMHPNTKVDFLSMRMPKLGPLVRIETELDTWVFAGEDENDPDSDEYIEDDWEAGRMSVRVHVRAGMLSAASRRRGVDQYDIVGLLWKLGFESERNSRLVKNYYRDDTVPIDVVDDLLDITRLTALGPVDLVATPDRYGSWFRRAS